MATACLAGSTGLVVGNHHQGTNTIHLKLTTSQGGNILTTLLESSAFSQVFAYSRKELPSNPKLTPLTSSDNTTWASLYPNTSQIFFSGLGTTRAQAGGFANQVKIDLDLNLELARAAKAAGTKVYVLISSAGANSSSRFGYPKMKGQLEDGVRELGFDHVIVLRPGMIVGPRDHLRGAELVLQTVAKGVGALYAGLKDPWAQDAQIIARAAVRAGQDALDGKETSNFRVVDQASIIRLGRTEWK